MPPNVSRCRAPCVLGSVPLRARSCARDRGDLEPAGPRRLQQALDLPAGDGRRAVRPTRLRLHPGLDPARRARQRRRHRSPATTRAASRLRLAGARRCSARSTCAASAEVGDRVRTGDIAVDFPRPVDLQPGTWPRDLGRAASTLIPRGVPSVLVGALLFGIALPATPSAVPAGRAQHRARRSPSRSPAGSPSTCSASGCSRSAGTAHALHGRQHVPGRPLRAGAAVPGLAAHRSPTRRRSRRCCRSRSTSSSGRVVGADVAVAAVAVQVVWVAALLRASGGSCCAPGAASWWCRVADVHATERLRRRTGRCSRSRVRAQTRLPDRRSSLDSSASSAARR